MVKVEQIGGYGEKVNGTVLRPEHVNVVGAIDDETKENVVAVKVLTVKGEEPVVLMFPPAFAVAVARLLLEKSAEMLAGETALRS